MIRKTATAMLLLLAGVLSPAAAQQTVTRQQVDDRKAVIATVEPIRELVARARIGGPGIDHRDRQARISQRQSQRRPVQATTGDQDISIKCHAPNMCAAAGLSMRRLAATVLGNRGELGGWPKAGRT